MSLTLIDAARRPSMAERKHKWIKAATADAHGQFRKKAERAGMSTRAYAEKEKGAGGTLGKQANLALNLMGMHHGAERRYAHMK